MDDLRYDLQVILDMIPQGSRVLDLGCGDGLLLETLRSRRNTTGLGIEISHEGIVSCVARGVAVQQADIDQGLAMVDDDSFDYVILSDTLQAVRRPMAALNEMLRIGRRGIVSFPNFGYWRTRWQLAVHGRMPETDALPHPWYATPNIHLCTLADFEALCRSLDVGIVARVPLSAARRRQGPLRHMVGTRRVPLYLANLLSPVAIYLLERKSP
ncbi:MAG: methionine biosynthesis protein MetW [Magnetococcus sp. WYHC-3]